MSKIVVVIGATGLQGGSVVTSLLKEGGFKVRALTRNPENDQAKALAARGVEIIKATGRISFSLSSFLRFFKLVFTQDRIWPS